MWKSVPDGISILIIIPLLLLWLLIRLRRFQRHLRCAVDGLGTRDLPRGNVDVGAV